MKTLTLNKSSWLLAAIFVSLACLAYPQKSLAVDSKVTCNTPVAWLTAGRAGTAPMEIVYCRGGSSVPGIVFFAFRISDNPNVANAIPTVIGSWVQVHGPVTSMTLYSDLTDISGVAWGCGAANCRILDQLLGY
jgi:hypothetical protein